MLAGAVDQWVAKHEKGFPTLEYFVIEGGLVLTDSTGATFLHRIVAKDPFSPHMDVEIMAMVESSTSVAVHGVAFAAGARASG